LLVQAIQALGARVTRVVITDLIDSTYHARILLDAQGRHVELDARPSDAIALAMRVEAPILAEEVVLERAGITPEPEQAPSEAEAKGEQDDRLSVFRDFVNQLDLDDLDPPRR
jgi:bifunctional DNase/RNase